MSTSDDSSTPDSDLESAKGSEDLDEGAAPEEGTSPETDAVPAKNRRVRRRKKGRTSDSAGDSTSDDPDSDDAADRKGDTKASTKRTRRGARPQAVPGLNPTWWAPVMCTLMVVGLLWIVVFYLLSKGPDNTWPIPGIGYGNLAIGFALIMAGFLMTTRWK